MVFSNGKLSAVGANVQPQTEKIVTLTNFRYSSVSSISGHQSGFVTATMKSKDGLFSNETDVSSTWQYYGGNVFVAGFTFALQSDSGETSYYEIAPYSVHVNVHTNDLDRYVRVFKSEL